MRVLHSVVTYLNVSENWIYPLIVQVPGVESSVLCSSVVNAESFPLNKIRLVVSPPPWTRSLGVPRFFNALARRIGCGGMAAALKLRAWSPQIVHAHFGTRGWESMTMKRWLKVPLVTSFYGYDAWLLPKSQPVWRERYHELFAEGDVFLVEGPAMATRLVELGCPKEKISIQRIGVNLDSLPFEAKQFSGDLKIVMVGRFVEKKGFIDGLRACAVARSRGVGLSVTIVGDSYADDPVGKQIKRELEEIANRPELAGAVHFAGFLPLDQTRNVLRTHNVLVCPSRHAANGDAEGGSPVALTEAMALGLLCIGTRHCDIPEIILDNQTGYLCEEGNFTAIADILTALGKDSNRLALLTRAGRKHVEEKFSLLIQLNGLHAVYKTTLSI